MAARRKRSLNRVGPMSSHGQNPTPANTQKTFRKDYNRLQQQHRGLVSHRRVPCILTVVGFEVEKERGTQAAEGLSDTWPGGFGGVGEFKLGMKQVKNGEKTRIFLGFVCFGLKKSSMVLGVKIEEQLLLCCLERHLFFV